MESRKYNIEGRIYALSAQGGLRRMKLKSMSKTSKTRKLPTVAEFERKFDEGKDISSHLDLSTIQVFESGQERLNLEIKKVNLDIPQWMIEELDRAAERIGVTRQSIIKMWLAERLEAKSSAYVQ